MDVCPSCPTYFYIGGCTNIFHYVEAYRLEYATGQTGLRDAASIAHHRQIQIIR
jgi:hypothetical protein